MKRRYYGPTENSERVSDLAVQAQQGDEEAMEKLIVEVEPVMLSLVRRYNLPLDVKEELLQEMRLRVFLDIKRYNRGRAAFGTWIASRFRSVIKPFLAREIGHGVSERTTLEAFRLYRWVNARYAETGFDGIDDELMSFAADAFLGRNVTREKVESILSSLDLQKSHLARSDYDGVLKNLEANGRSNPETPLIERDIRDKVREIIKFTDLPPLWREVLRLRYCGGKGVPELTEVAKVMGTARQAASLKEHEARKVLKQQLVDSGFEPGDYIDCNHSDR